MPPAATISARWLASETPSTKETMYGAVGPAAAVVVVAALVVVAASVVVAAPVVAASVVVAASLVVAASDVVASVDVVAVSELVAGAPVVSAGVEEVVVELISASSAENGLPSASALEVITPRSSSATHATATLLILLVLLLEFLTFLPLFRCHRNAAVSGHAPRKTTTDRRSPSGSFRVSPPAASS